MLNIKILTVLKRFEDRFSHLLGFSISRIKPRPAWPGDKSRYEYQRLYNDFEIPEGDIVLDIGSGGYPFPFATFLTDRYIEPTGHRKNLLVTSGKPFFLSAIEALPFTDKTVDYVYCSHLLEHVNDPVAACAEIVRVGKRGYIETPTLAKDMLFSWAKGMHKWHLTSIANKLIFFEYSERQLEGVKSKAWKDKIFSPHYEALQELFYTNQDLFNVMFRWEHGFECVVYHLDGRIRNQELS